MTKKINEPKKRGRPRFKWKMIFYGKYNKDLPMYDPAPFIEFDDPAMLAKRLSESKRDLWYQN